MPRKLPWAAEAAAPSKKPPGSANKRTSSPGLPVSSKRLHVSSHTDLSKGADHASDDNDDDNDDLVDANLKSLQAPNPAFHRRIPKPTDAERILRDPSTSPPPSQPISAPGPPETILMRPGLKGDDGYLMVEDEFLSTAKLYTQHIHHAEYVRLKRLAKSRGQKTLDALSRGTDGKTEQSAGVKLRLDAVEGRRKREEGLRSLVDAGEAEDKKRNKKKRDWESESSEDEYMLVPQLAGLMAKDESKSRDLSGVLKPKSRSRAAAGFEQSPNNVERKRDALRDEGGDSRNVVRRKGKDREKFMDEEELLDNDDNNDDEDDDDDDDLGRQPQSKTHDTVYHSRRNERTKGRIPTSDARSPPKRAADASMIFKRFSNEETPRRPNGLSNADQNSDPASKSPSTTRNTATMVSPRGDIYSRRKADPPSSPPSMPGTPLNQSKRKEESASQEDWMEKKRGERSAAAEFIAKRRAAREKQARRDEMKTKTNGRADDVPTFMF